jgi:hypothetical protein
MITFVVVGSILGFAFGVRKQLRERGLSARSRDQSTEE